MSDSSPVDAVAAVGLAVGLAVVAAVVPTGWEKLFRSVVDSERASGQAAAKGAVLECLDSPGTPSWRHFVY